MGNLRFGFPDRQPFLKRLYIAFLFVQAYPQFKAICRSDVTYTSRRVYALYRLLPRFKLHIFTYRLVSKPLNLAMTSPFGISIGDFIAVANLAQGIIQSLSEARGAAAQYTSLIELLRSISTSLSTITSFLASSTTSMLLRIDDAFRNGICFQVECCRRLMKHFLARRFFDFII